MQDDDDAADAKGSDGSDSEDDDEMDDDEAAFMDGDMDDENEYGREATFAKFFAGGKMEYSDDEGVGGDDWEKDGTAVLDELDAAEFDRTDNGGGAGDSSDDDDDEDEDDEDEDMDSQDGGMYGGMDEDDDGFDLLGGLEDDMGDDDSDDGPEPRTAHERRQKELRRQAAELEAKALGAKDWSMTGEATAKQRPENSLLEAVLEYDAGAAKRPERALVDAAAAAAAREGGDDVGEYTGNDDMGEEHPTIEAIITKRVIEDRWDDLVYPTGPAARAKDDGPELSQEKAKVGLGDEYEQDFLKSTGDFVDTAQVAADREALQLRSMFDALSRRLDALSNFHYTPKPIAQDLTVAPKAKAITMEDVVPVGVSAADSRAPEEVMAPLRGKKAYADIKDAGELKALASQRQAQRQRRREARDAKAAAEKRHVAPPGTESVGTKSSKFFADLEQTVAGDLAKAAARKGAGKKGGKRAKTGAAGDGQAEVVTVRGAAAKLKL